METRARARVLIVDDSAVMRNVLRSVVSGDPGLEVAGTAVDGATALQSIPMLRPDVVLLDLEMPVMDGLTTLRRLRMEDASLPVIVVSSQTHRGARATIDALANGASDYVAKPAEQANRQTAEEVLAAEVRPRIHALARAVRKPGVLPAASASIRQRNVGQHAVPCTGYGSAPAESAAVVAIGLSTGGPAALEKVLPRLPADFPLPVIVVQHMPEVFTGMLAERLDRTCALRVKEGAEGDRVVPGTVFLARGGQHLELARGAGAESAILRLTSGPPENHCRPSVDVLFRSVAEIYGGRALAVVLTGMGNDGLAGCRVLRRAGATVMVQDQPTSVVWGMPGAVAGDGLADRILPLDEIAPELMRMVHCARPGQGREALV